MTSRNIFGELELDVAKTFLFSCLVEIPNAMVKNLISISIEQNLSGMH